MLPRLSAEESMRAANQIAYGTGNLEKDTARRMADRWTQQANPQQRAAKATPQQLGSMGIKVRSVARQKHG